MDHIFDDETAGDLYFAEELSKLADYYVNDAFGTAHRAHASTTMVANFFEGNKCFGNLLENEINSLEKVLSAPKKPFTAIIGGAKVSGKINVIENLMDKVTDIIIGGGINNPQDLEKVYEAGANVVVIGTSVENDFAIIHKMAQVRNQFNSKVNA